YILESPLDARQDLKGCLEVLTKIQLNLETSDPSVASLLRTQNMLNHLHNRVERITRSDDIKKEYDDIVSSYKNFSQKLSTLLAKKPSTSTSLNVPSAGFAKDSASTVPEPQNVISVSCDRTSSDLSKLKFTGKTCVRSFIQRVDEFILARNIPQQKVLSFASEIFQDDALHWYRAVKDKVSSWPELARLLKEDFSQADYDYRLISEIRSRTQGERENITIYLAVMNGMFSRLSTPPSEVDQLEILLHNIRPCYASTLAAAPQISTIDTLRSLCRNYETFQTRLSQFQEPPKVTSDTLAPEFAYTKDVHKYINKPNNNNHNKYNNSNNSNNYSNNKYIHAVNVAKKEPYCPRCRNNTHHIRQCKAPRDIVCFKVATILLSKPLNDSRPYVNIKINNIDAVGLLDSGAAVSILGNNSHLQLTDCTLNQDNHTKMIAAGEFDWKEVVPSEFRESIIAENHSEPTGGHLGIFKTYRRLSLNYYWPNMHQDVVKFVGSCSVCLSYKAQNHTTLGEMGRPKQCSRPFQMISIDFVGPLPTSRKQNSYILVVTCCFSKYCHIFPVRRATADIVIKILEDSIFLVHGVPQTIFLDNGTQFISSSTDALFKKYKIPNVFFTPKYTPQVNTVERYNKTIVTSLSTFVGNDHRSWDTSIPKVQFAINNSVNEATGYTPSFLVYGRELVLCGSHYTDNDLGDEVLFLPRDLYAENLGCLRSVFNDVQASLWHAHEKNTAHYNLRRKPAEFNVGDIVYKRAFVLSNRDKYFCKKLAPKFIKCRIIEKRSPLVYVLEDMTGKNIGVWHIKDLKNIKCQ
ncbi:hypothetical protein HW555_008803, partial [Spodoptera exigua]